MSIEQTCTTNAKQRMHAKNYDEYFETPNKSNGRREKKYLDKYIPNTSEFGWEKEYVWFFFSSLCQLSFSRSMGVHRFIYFERSNAFELDVFARAIYIAF